MISSVIRRRSVRWAAVGALLLPLTLYAVPSAQAADGPYTIDGTIPDLGLPANAELPDDSGSVKELGPLNSNTTKIGVIHDDAVPTLGKTNPNGQVDLRRAWLDTERATDGDDWLYFAWERDANSGSGFIAYEFMQSPPPAECAYTTATNAELIADCNPWRYRQDGDFMILWDQQGGSRDLWLREWSGTPGNLTLSPPGDPLKADVSAAEYSADGFRGEAAVNLTDTVFAGQQDCVSFANTIPSTVTGNSDTADYKDTILEPAPVITNCGTVTVKKVTDPAGDTDTSFTWTMKRADDSDLRYTGTDKKQVSDTIKDGETDTVSNLIAGGNYTLAETDPGPKYALKSIVCVLDGTSYDVKAGGTFPVEAGETTACTITNELQKGTLIVEKIVVNDNGGTKVATEFKFRVGSGSPVSFGSPISFLQDPNTLDTYRGRNDLTVQQGTYSVVEPAVSGYTTTYANSANTNTNCTNLFVPAGGSVTCTITNNDDKASPSGTTKQSWVLHDELTITGIRDGAPDAASATATFRLYSNATCTAQVGSDETVSINAGKAATSTGVSVNQTGDYYWRVQYSGDQYNNGFTTACGDEISQIRAKDQGRNDLILN